MTEILICGKTELFTEEALEKLAEECRVVVAGKIKLSGRKKNIFVYHTAPNKEQFHQLFDVYSFRTVFYVSGYADGGDGMFGELQQLEQVMQECEKSRADKLVVISSIDSQNYSLQYRLQREFPDKEYFTSRNFQVGQLEETCGYFMKRTKLCTIILQTPYLADRVNDKNFLGKIFHRIYKREKVTLPYRREDPIDFITLDDLTELMLQINEETEDESGIYCVTSGYHYTYGELEEMLRLITKDIHIVYNNYPYMPEIPEFSRELRTRYGFIVKDNAMENIGVYYRTFAREVMGHRYGMREKLADFMKSLGKEALIYVEMIVLFVIVELLSQITSDNVYFRFVDVRLFYIVIMGTIHGMRFGIAAAIFECFALVRQYSLIGMNPTVLFYNIENWIPFAIYLLAGSVTGYVSNKRTDAMAYLRQEYTLLRDKYVFLSDVYHGAIQNKDEYKKQILGFKDSFGKIFDAVQKLDSERPERIFYEGIGILEDILENHSIAIYTLDSWQRFGRLAVCSNSLLTRLTKSIRIDDYREMYETVKNGGVWKNTEFTQGLPMYACGIFRDDMMVLLVTIQEADIEQYGMRYMNIFQILCGLVQTSFLRAMEYEELAQSQIYYPDTNIVYPERMKQLVETQTAMKDEGIADFVLLRLEDKDRKRVSEKLEGLVRASDVVGADEEGNIYLLLVQMNQKNLRIVGERLDRVGIRYEIVEKID
nr:hypothetical protein [uncultured Merdimonas sp.]